MESIIDKEALALMQPINNGMISLLKIASLLPLTPAIFKCRFSTDQIVNQLESMLEAYRPILETIGNSEQHPALLQTQIFVVRTMKEIIKPLSQFINASRDIPFQRPDSLDKLLKLNKELATVEVYERRLAQSCSFPLNKADLKSHIGNQKLKEPLRIYIEDYEDGKHVSCFEIPQVYGCGDSEEEALAMLDREIVSMISDLDEGGPLSLEFQALKIFLDSVIFNAKQQL